jgi:uncharacterized protein (DUF1800 family)
MALTTERDKLAHLLRRVCFGALPQDLESYGALGLAGAIERVLDYGSLNEDFDTPVWDFEVQTNNGGIALRAPAVAAWWAWRMLQSRRPLEQKLTLFWHDHFGCSGEVVKPGPLLYQHLETLRTHALGPFEALLLAVAKDPTMMTFLDTRDNVKAHPNENFARELLELFTVGIGNYSEQDVLEGARAFTGWSFKRPEDFEYLFYEHPQVEFIFRANQHDEGPKTFLGHSGNFGGEDIIRILSARPETALYISTKLWEWFAYYQPERSVSERIAGVFSRSGGSIKETLRAIFSAPEFYSPKAERALYKSPADFVIGTLRACGIEAQVERQLEREQLKASADGNGEKYGVAQPIGAAARLAAFSMANMGQRLLFPPNVAGWDGGSAWVNSATMLERIKLAELFSPQGFKLARPNAPAGRQQKGRSLPYKLLLGETECHNPMQVAEQCSRQLDSGLGVDKLTLIAQTVAESLGPDLRADQLQEAVHQTVRLIFASPEYQFM